MYAVVNATTIEIVIENEIVIKTEAIVKATCQRKVCDKVVQFLARLLSVKKCWKLIMQLKRTLPGRRWWKLPTRSLYA